MQPPHRRFHFLADFRQENQKLKELVTGGASAAGSCAAPTDAEAAEAKEEPMKEESPAVRPKMEANTPQKVVLKKVLILTANSELDIGFWTHYLVLVI